MTDRQTSVPAGSHGGPFHTGQPRFICVHSLEAPARAGMAWSLACGWMQGAGTSVHAITDPGESVDLVGLGIIAYHCGGGNDYAIGDEHTGYAAWTFAEWTTEPAFSALRNGARKAAKQALQLGIPRRWLSLAQIRDGQSKGFVTHNDMRLVFGGTTHTDPGPGFPYALFIKMCQQFAGDPVKATPTPNPLPTGEQIGGAQKEWFMAITPEDEAALRTIISSEVTKTQISNGIVGAGDIHRLTTAIEPYIRKWVSEEANKTQIANGIVGAGDLSRLEAALVPAIVAALTKAAS